MVFFEIDDEKSHNHIINTIEGYVSNDNSQYLHKILEKILNLNNGSQIYLAGESGSGKSAFITSFLKNKENKIVILDAYSLKNPLNDVKSIIRTHLRNSTKIIFKDSMKIVEGEVVGLSENRLILKTMDMESAFDIGTRISAELKRERVVVGDILKIYKDNGFVCKVGRSVAQRQDLQSIFVPQTNVPEGECLKTEIVETKLSLHEIDIINAQQKDASKHIKFNSDVSPSLQTEVDQKILKMVKEDKAEILKGIIVIKNCHALPKEIFNFILLLKNNELGPSIIFSGQFVPPYILNKIIVLYLDKMNKERAISILRNRALYLGCDIENDALAHLGTLSIVSGLRYALSILEISFDGTGKVGINNIKKSQNLFIPFDESSRI